MKILVGYEGSNAAKDALMLSIKHAKAFDAKVHIVTSLSDGDGDDVKAIRRAEKELDDAKKHFDVAGVASESHLLIRGLSPGEDIVTFAGDNRIDGIVIGVKRRSRVGKALFGSNAQYVILNASCPVTTVR